MRAKQVQDKLVQIASLQRKKNTARVETLIQHRTGRNWAGGGGERNDTPLRRSSHVSLTTKLQKAAGCAKQPSSLILKDTDLYGEG